MHADSSFFRLKPDSSGAVKEPADVARGRGVFSIERASTLLERQPLWLLWNEAILLVLIVGVLDFVTGYEVSAVLFYSFPILLMVRFADLSSAIFVALFCALVWWWVDEAAGNHYVNFWHQAWETAVRLSCFLLFAIGGSAVKSRVELLEHSQRLEQEIISISEREQRRIGQDLHDGLCQYFAAVGCSLGGVKGRLERKGEAEAAAVAEVQTMILEGVHQVRSLARGLFPVQNDEWGLHSALSELAASARYLRNMDCTFDSNTVRTTIDNAAATHLFRIGQEALSNALRHGLASEATIHLEVGRRVVTLTVTDNGGGFSPELADRGGLGLGIMRYRARQMNGVVSFSNHPNGGAIVTCRVPCAGTAARP